MKKDRGPNATPTPEWIILTKPSFDPKLKKWVVIHKDSVTGEMKTHSYTHRQSAQNKYDEIVLFEKEKKKEELGSKEKNNTIKKTTAKKEKNKYGIESYNLEIIYQRHKEILADIIEGMPSKEIEKKYAEIYNLSTNTVQMDISKVTKQIKEYSMHHHQDVVAVHMERYEMFFRRFRELGNDTFAMKCLRLKENLYGIHNEVVTMQINNYHERVEEGEKYNIKEINELQKKRLNIICRI